PYKPGPSRAGAGCARGAPGRQGAAAEHHRGPERAAQRAGLRPRGGPGSVRPVAVEGARVVAWAGVLSDSSGTRSLIERWACGRGDNPGPRGRPGRGGKERHMADVTAGDRGEGPAGHPDPTWDDLTPDQRAGMTRDYWERELDSVARTGLAGLACSHPDCTASRWV